MKSRGRLPWVAGVTLIALAIPFSSLRANDPKDDAKDHKHDAHESASGHVHADVPAEYKRRHVPAAAWTDPRMITRGKEIYATRCAVCHGETGDGKGPAGVALPIKPPDLRDTRMVNEMAGNYWFWRVSEGATVEPFKSMGSVMPAWKDELSVEDRWAVIAYQHTFSGHTGPHVTSEHPPTGTAHGAPTQSSTPAPAVTSGGHRH